MAVTIRGSGQVPVQVIQTVKTDTFTTTSSGFTDITGLSVNITPTSASNRILVLFSTNIGIDTSPAYSGGVRLVRNSTPIFLGTQVGSRTPASAWSWSPDLRYNIYTLSGSFLDSPATTSATTYKLQLVSGYSGSPVNINRDGSNDDGSFTGLVPSQITVMEISG
jgi:hypothetical protein